MLKRLALPTIPLRVFICVTALALTSCLEPQPAPDLPEQPVSDFTLDIVADGLKAPWAAVPLPDGGYLVTGKFGDLWRIENGTVQDISGLPPEIEALAANRIATDGQGGLLDVALAPDFETSGLFYMSYSYGDWQANGTALMRARLEGNRIVDAQTLFRAGPAKEAGSHYGGKIVFPDDRSLLLSLGDGFALREEAQRRTSHLGSIVRLALDGTAAPSNPDLGPDRVRDSDGSALPELFTIGHRNVQGLTIDPQTGTIWQHEHGPRGGDELNRIEPGANYGWPIATYGRDYQGARISPFEDHAGYTAPIHVWTPSIAPSGLAVYRGNIFPDWNGHVLVGGLASGDLRRVDPSTGDETRLLSDAKTQDDPFRVRDVDVDRDGSVLLVVEDSENGRLIRLSPAR